MDNNTASFIAGFGLLTAILQVLAAVITYREKLLRSPESMETYLVLLSVKKTFR